VNGCTGHDLRLGDRVVAAEHDRDGVGGQHDLDRLLDRAVRALGIGRDDRSVAEVDDSDVGERVDSGLEMRARRRAGNPDRPRSEPRPRAVGDEVVRRRADDGDVRVFELGRILGVRRAAEAQQAGVVGLLAVLAPALARVVRSDPPL
jgi:hypothetical protein